MNFPSFKAFKSDDSLPKLWWRFQWWWTDSILYRYAPQWLRFFWRDINSFYYDQISTRIWPRQRWLTKQIRRDWTDKTNLIPDLLYAMVIHFVDKDGEDCFGVNDWEGSGHGEEAAKLREIYEWAKTGRAEFFKRIETSHPIGPNDFTEWMKWFNEENPARDAAYQEVRRLEEEMEKRDTDHLTWIISHRGLVWT